jgi:hypothetical protein
MFELNLKQALEKERDSLVYTPDLEYIINRIFKESKDKKERILFELEKNNDSQFNDLVFDKLDRDRIFHIDSIKKLCIKYRLRFLDTNLFKGKYPEELFNIIPALEIKHNSKFKNFKIIAPSKLFILKSREDPLLFVPIGNNYYYLIHKWGRDLKTYRKFLFWPLKNLNTLIYTSIFLSLASTLIFSLFFNGFSNIQLFLIFLFNIKTFVFITFYSFFMMRKNFNESIWNHNYIN